jgi:hypothetical protein
MAQVDPKVVRQVADQVIQALIERGVVSPLSQASETDPPSNAPSRSSSRPKTHAAGLAPPIGVCTGDYAQFPERPDLLSHRRLHANANDDRAGQTTHAVPVRRAAPSTSQIAVPITRAANGKPQAPTANRSTADNAAKATSSVHDLTGFVTARRLADANATTIRLAPTARLTPLARDYVKARGLVIQRSVNAPNDALASAGASNNRNTMPFLWWIEGQCRNVTAVTEANGGALRPSSQPAGPEALTTMIAELDDGVRKGRYRGGILFVRNAARAGCFANRCARLRGVVGTCEQAVQQGLGDVAANVLIIEYPYHDQATMQAMVQHFVTGERGDWAAVNQALEGLRTCG